MYVCTNFHEQIHFGREDVKPAWEVIKDLSHEIPAEKLYGKVLGMGNPIMDIIANTGMGWGGLRHDC